MITLKNWIVDSNQNHESASLSKIYETCFLGEELSLDDRLEWAAKSFKHEPGALRKVSYNHENALIAFSPSGGVQNVGDLHEQQPPSGRILFDATSLLIPELTYLMEWANFHGKDFDVVYAEPSEYSSTSYKSKIGIESIDYSLSEDGPGIDMLPRFTSPIDKSHLVVSLGYEGHRFGALLISDEITPTSMSCVVGVPPFILGWERTTYAKNYSEMRDAKKQYEADYQVIPANDPLQAYEAINTIYKANAAEARGGRARLNLVPIGTKPIALAMSWFAINHKGTGILYDFVKKKPKRSKGIGKIHLWEFSCSG